MKVDDTFEVGRDLFRFFWLGFGMFFFALFVAPSIAVCFWVRFRDLFPLVLLLLFFFVALSLLCFLFFSVFFFFASMYF